MAEPEPTLDEWRRLYQAAMRFKGLAPWQWMEETDMFGAQNPETGDLGLASVMGALGQHLALALYLGPEGLAGFWQMQEMGEAMPPEALLDTPHLQASFEDRDELTDRDRAVIKELGLKFRGRQAWPLFRSYRPGFAPWYLEGAEARFLAHALEQTVEVAPRVREDPALLVPPGEDRYLVRVPREVEGALVWEDQVLTVPPAEPPSISIVMDLELLERVKRLPLSDLTLEVDFFMVPITIGERGERPSFPHLLLAVDSATGVVLTGQLLEPQPSPQAMWGRLPLTLLTALARVEVVPRRFRVRSPLVAQVLRPLAEELGSEIKPAPSLRKLDEAAEFLLRRFA